VWNHEHRRLARFGPRQTAWPRTSSRRCAPDGSITSPSPSDDALVEQLREELTVSRGHLRTVLDDSWDRDWRREQSGYDRSPEDHLWRATTAVEDMRDALDELTGG
jgi:hypothetical protein